MKMTEKTKRKLVIYGSAIICIALIVAIGLQFRKVFARNDEQPMDTPSATEVMVEPDEVTTGKTDEKELSSHTDSKDTAQKVDSNTPVDTRPAQTDQSEQSIQPEITKPAEPEEKVKTDPTHKPDGAKVKTPPKSEEHEAVVAPSEPKALADEPQAGDTQNGQIYIPGFGWTENHGGGGSGTTADDMYENGNKIGIMD